MSINVIKQMYMINLNEDYTDSVEKKRSTVYRIRFSIDTNKQ